MVICGGVGGIANVTYWALASRYDVHCIKAVSTGMTVGGLLTQAIAVGQDAGATPRFSVRWYFVAVAALQMVLVSVMLPISRMGAAAEDDAEDEGEDDDDAIADGGPGGDVAGKPGSYADEVKRLGIYEDDVAAAGEFVNPL